MANAIGILPELDKLEILLCSLLYHKLRTLTKYVNLQREEEITFASTVLHKSKEQL
jgi:hypothetical protein